MKPITAPLHYGDSGADVTNLQDALLMLLRKHVIHTDEQQFLEDRLTGEQQA